MIQALAERPRPPAARAAIRCRERVHHRRLEALASALLALRAAPLGAFPTPLRDGVTP